MSDREKRLIDANELKDSFVFFRKMWSATEICGIIDAMPTADVTVQKWIPVSERLPEEEGWYWVFTTPNRGYRSINKGEFSKGYHWNNFTPYWRGAGGTWTNVTHWMPLPSTEGLKND